MSSAAMLLASDVMSRDSRHANRSAAPARDACRAPPETLNSLREIADGLPPMPSSRRSAVLQVTGKQERGSQLLQPTTRPVLKMKEYGIDAARSGMPKS